MGLRWFSSRLLFSQFALLAQFDVQYAQAGRQMWKWEEREDGEV
jgi:hypothetical protein